MDVGERTRLRRLLGEIYDEMGRAAESAIRRFAPGGRVPTTRGGTGTTQGAEPPLGNPDTDHALLTSTAGGVRSWWRLVAGPGLTLALDTDARTITISLGAPIVYLTDEDGAYLVDADGAYLVEYQ